MYMHILLDASGFVNTWMYSHLHFRQLPMHVFLRVNPSLTLLLARLVYATEESVTEITPSLSGKM